MLNAFLLYSNHCNDSWKIPEKYNNFKKSELIISHFYDKIIFVSILFYSVSFWSTIVERFSIDTMKSDTAKSQKRKLEICLILICTIITCTTPGLKVHKREKFFVSDFEFFTIYS
jgi:hypothetical protein